jgi:hypothetical protein
MLKPQPQWKGIHPGAMILTLISGFGLTHEGGKAKRFQKNLLLRP